MKANLLRLQSEWETFQSTHARDAVYQYLTAVFELVAWWAEEGRAVGRARITVRRNYATPLRVGHPARIHATGVGELKLFP